MGLNDRRSVLGINAPYAVVFPVPDGAIGSNLPDGSDFRQVGYSYRGFNKYVAAGGTLYVDSASIIKYLRNSQEPSLAIGSEASVPSRFVLDNQAALLIGSLNSLFYSLRTSSEAGISSPNNSSLIKSWGASSEAAINIGGSAGLFSNMLASPLGSLLIDSASSLSSQIRVDNLPALSISNNVNLLGTFSTQSESTVFGNLVGECSSAIDFAVGTIAALSLSSSINMRTESILGGDGGVSSLNSADIRTNLVTDTVPAVVGSLIGLCDMATSLRLSAGEQLLIGSAINLLSTTKLENLPALSISSVIPIIKRIESQTSPSLSIGAAASLTNNFLLQEDISLLMNALSNLIKEWKTIAGGGLLYSNSADLSVSSATSPLISVFLNSIFAATATFGQQNSGGLNLASEVYFINRLATESNIRASIIGAVDLAGRFHIFSEEPEVNGLGQFYVADFILRRKSLEELNLYRVALSHNNLHVQQSSLKDLSLSQIRSYILQIKDTGLFEVNRRI